MLITPNKSIQKNDIVTFRIVTGEEILGKFIEIEDTPYGRAIKLEKPVVAQVHMVSPQQAALAFMPFLAAGDEKSVCVLLDRLLTVPFAPRKDVHAQYVKATTGLDIAAGIPQGGISL